MFGEGALMFGRSFDVWGRSFDVWGRSFDVWGELLRFGGGAHSYLDVWRSGTFQGKPQVSECATNCKHRP